MTKNLIINAIEPREIRAAILDDGEPINFFVERSEKRHQKGNIYHARVSSIEPHLQAAFVELEKGQHGFLSLSDIIFPDGGHAIVYDKALKRAEADKTEAKPSNVKKELESDASEKRLTEIVEEEVPVAKSSQVQQVELSPEAGDMLLGDLVVDTDPSNSPIIEKEIQEVEEKASETNTDTLESAAQEEDNSTEKAGTETEVDTAIIGNIDEEVEEEEQRKPKKTFKKIEDILEVGQHLVVQIIKEGIGKKAPMVTTYLSLAGHYMVLTPGGDKSGISRQLRDPSERKRLREFVEKTKVPDHCGLIVRTAAEGISKKDLGADIRALTKNWKEIKKQAKLAKETRLLKSEAGLITRLIRDYYHQDIEEVWIDDTQACEEVKEFFKDGMSSQVERVKLFNEAKPIFSHYNLESSIKTLFKRYAPLPGGGSLVFDQGEAMLVIDINSGTYKDGKNDEDTAFKLNMLACQEIARQVQMRDVGGIIMVDFVDMRRISSRNKVEKELEKAFKGDKAKINIMSIGPLGVLQMSRQRTKDSLRNSLYSTCTVCEGTGLVPSKGYSALGILREIRENVKQYKNETLKLYTTTECVLILLNQYKRDLMSIEQEMHVDIQILVDEKLNVGEFYIPSKGKSRRSNSKSKSNEEQNTQKTKRKKNRKPKSQQQEAAPEKASLSKNALLEKLEREHPGGLPLGIIQNKKGLEKKDDEPGGKKELPEEENASNDEPNDKGPDLEKEPILKEKGLQDQEENSENAKSKAEKPEEIEKKPLKAKAKRGRPSKKKKVEKEATTSKKSPENLKKENSEQDAQLKK